MADEPVAVAEPEIIPAEPVVEVETPTPEPSPAEELARLREDKARLEGEVTALRRQSPPAAAAPVAPQPPAAVYTPTQIDAAFAAGTIDAARKSQEYERYTEHVALTAAQTIRDQDSQRALGESIGTRLQAHIAARPGLSQFQTPETQAARDWVQSRGGDFNDRRWQLAACDALWGVKGAVVDRRTSLPGGGGGGRPAGGSPGGPPPSAGATAGLQGIPTDYVAYWRSRGANLSDPKVAKKYADRFWSTRPGQRARSGAA